MVFGQAPLLHFICGSFKLQFTPSPLAKREAYLSASRFFQHPGFLYIHPMGPVGKKMQVRR